MVGPLTVSRQSFKGTSFKGLIERLPDQSAKIKIRITHPMQTGYNKTSPRHFMSNFQCHLNKTLVFSAEFESGISTNPPLFFKVGRLESQDVIELSWQDNLEHSDQITVTVD